MTDDPMRPSREPQQFRDAARCGARTRAGKPCQSPAVAGRRRCRTGSGGPKGPRNGNYRHGLYTAEMTAARRSLKQHVREVRALIKRLRP